MPDRCRVARMPVVTAVALLAACGVPQRFALPVALPLVQGGTAVPARGGGGAMEFGDGFLGQELMRTEIFSLGLIGGAWDRISISLNAFTEIRGNEMSGTFLRAKGRIGPVLGPRSSAGVAFAISTSARESGDVQDEQVNSFDFPIPAEFLLETSQNRKRDLSGYLAPRVVFENYVDQLDRTQSLTATYWGALAGVHARVSNGHFFGELNLLHLPRRTARGTELAGGFIVVPALGFAFHFGQAHRWED